MKKFEQIINIPYHVDANICKLWSKLLYYPSVREHGPIKGHSVP